MKIDKNETYEEMLARQKERLKKEHKGSTITTDIDKQKPLEARRRPQRL